MKDCCIKARCALALLAGLGLAGCAEMTFKAGAGPGDFTAAEQACRAPPNTGEAAYEACMNARGFQVHRRTESVFVGADETPAAVSAEAVTAAGPDHQTEAPMTATTPARPSATPRPGPAPAPRGPVQVSSWWKFGGTAGEFTAAREACLATLQEPHSANSNENVASLALVACLRRAGWVGIAKR